ncbi:acetyl-CoA synthetase-like protein [Xylariaceae sp. FL0804]|nr:acetyl-CoA synthetase-like protein [Xylariaceae sp. FL0804]
MSQQQDEDQRQSLADPAAFWGRQAERLHWHRRPKTVLTRTTKRLTLGGGETVHHPHWTWFDGGEISTCFNCVDRHVAAGRGDAPALLFDSPVSDGGAGRRSSLTYAQLLDEVEVTAGALREEGVRRGDVVLVYMPMIPAALVGILAVNRLGAIHAAVFGGFAAAALAQRIEACRPVAVLTASCGLEGAKPPIPYRPLVTEAVRLSSHKPSRVLVWQRNELRWDALDKAGGERNWFKVVRSCRARGIRAECVPVAASDPVYIIYTSGTTGTPKGVVRSAGGNAVGLHFTMGYVYGVHGPGDVMFTASDIGWVVGHSYILYGPLLTGAATVVFEGKPVGTPDSSTFWRIVQEYKVTSLFTAPTALRAIKRDDPENQHLRRVGERGGLRSLRALFLAGERSEPSLVSMYEGLVRRYGAPGGAAVIDHWWSSESGSPISGLCIGEGEGNGNGRIREPPVVKPGSAGRAMPGFDVRVVDDGGDEVPRGSMGNIVLAGPLAPTGFTTLWEDEERFYQSYLQRFGGRWIDTGDAGMIDPEGYISIMSRSDDLINCAGHRLSTGSIEQAITGHPAVAEASVVGIPDALKGQLPFAFVTLSTTGAGSDHHPESAVPSAALADELQRRVRAHVGGIAALGGVIQGRGMIPKTRSGKTLRRVLRELVENAVHGEYDKEVQVPATVEDAAAVDVAREKVREYFRERGAAHRAIETRAKL